MRPERLGTPVPDAGRGPVRNGRRGAQCAGGCAGAEGDGIVLPLSEPTPCAEPWLGMVLELPPPVVWPPELGIVLEPELSVAVASRSIVCWSSEEVCCSPCFFWNSAIADLVCGPMMPSIVPL